MSNNKWHYYINSKAKGSITLEEIITGFNECRFTLYNVWFRKSNDVYWRKINAIPEILCGLEWDYIKDGVIIHNISGKEVIDLYLKQQIDDNTQIKLSLLSEWTKLADCPLLRHKEGTSKYFGFASTALSWKHTAANVIDLIPSVAILFLVSNFGFSVDLPFDFPIPAFFKMMIFLSLISPCFFALEAFFICWKGWTFGTRLVNLYILNSQGIKLSFKDAIKRQFSTYVNRFFWQQKHHEEMLYSASQWDLDHHIIITDQRPCHATLRVPAKEV